MFGLLKPKVDPNEPVKYWLFTFAFGDSPVGAYLKGRFKDMFLAMVKKAKKDGKKIAFRDAGAGFLLTFEATESEMRNDKRQFEMVAKGLRLVKMTVSFEELKEKPKELI
jgi:hypothetical protein